MGTRAAACKTPTPSQRCHKSLAAVILKLFLINRFSYGQNQESPGIPHQNRQQLSAGALSHRNLQYFEVLFTTAFGVSSPLIKLNIN